MTSLSPKVRAMHLSVVVHELDRIRQQNLLRGAEREKLLDLRDSLKQEIADLEAGRCDEVAP